MAHLGQEVTKGTKEGWMGAFHEAEPKVAQIVPKKKREGTRRLVVFYTFPSAEPYLLHDLYTS